MRSIIACLENKLTAVKSMLKISSFEKLKNCSFQYDEAVQSHRPTGQLWLAIINIKWI